MAHLAGRTDLVAGVSRGIGHEGMVSFAVAPSWAKTEMAAQYVATQGIRAAVADIPIGRMADPAEVGELIAFALQPSHASRNGATLDVNGGSYMR